MKKSKDKRYNIIITIVLAVLPIIYFAISTYLTLDLFTIKLHTDLGYGVEEILQMHDSFNESLMFNGIWIGAYVLFLFFLLLDILLYKKSKKTVFIIFNIIVLLLAIVCCFFLYPIALELLIIPLIFIVLATISLSLSYKLK